MIDRIIKTLVVICYMPYMLSIVLITPILAFIYPEKIVLQKGHHLKEIKYGDEND